MALGLVLMYDWVQRLQRLADEIQRTLVGFATIQVNTDETYFEMSVVPTGVGPCPFTMHSDEREGLTIEFGVFSIGHIFTSDQEELLSSAQALAHDLINGNIVETVSFVNGKACKATAEVGTGDDVVRFSTRQGLCLRAELRVFHYSSYRSGVSRTDGESEQL